MKADLIVTGGLLVDGTGGAPQTGDLAIADGRIVAVGDISAIDPDGAEIVDAEGCIVTPGFVDIHTHYDGQAVWTDRLRPSTDHGVTTVVIGNCGVGFAPCRPADHDSLIGLMEGVEDIPGVVMAEGLDWSWESFEDFLNIVEARAHDCDIAAYLPHSPLRVYVMGERGIAREPATEADLAQMRALAARAIDAGALGCATSRLYYHRTAQGELIPSFNASEEELHALAAGIVDAGGGVLQLVPNYENPDITDELDLMARVARQHDITVTFTGTTSTPGIAEMLEQRRAQGADLKAQIFPRPIGMVVGLNLSWNPFYFCDAFEPLRPMSAKERAERMRDPELRATLIAQQPDVSRFPMARQARNFARMYPLTPGFDYEPGESDSVAARASVRGVSPEEEAYDLLLKDDGAAMMMVAMGNYADGNLDAVRSMIGLDGTVLGLGDGGAHYALICDASYPTSLLSHWVRDRIAGRIPVQDAVRELTSKPASVVGLEDRGVLRAGCKADVNIIDLNRLELHLPYPECDLPAGGKRLLQDASGYRATILSGRVTYRDGKPTGALPGTLVRGRQAAPA